MAQLTEANQVGKREDLSDLIANVDAHETPVFSMMPKGKRPENSLFEWQMDSHGDPQTDGVPDGQDVTSFENQAESRVMAQGRVQHVRRSWKVTNLAQDLSNVAGIKSEKANSVAKALVKVKRDIEATICSDNESSAGPSFKTRGIGKWIQSTAQTDLPVSAAYLTPAASIDTTAMASLTEGIIQGVLQSIWTETGKKGRYACPCGAAFKRTITDFTVLQKGVSSSIAAIRQYNTDVKGGMIYQTIDLFEGDFGTLEFVPTIFLAHGTANAPTRRAYVLDMSNWSIRTLRNPGSQELADGGGGPRGYVDSIFALQCNSPLAAGKWAATS